MPGYYDAGDADAGAPPPSLSASTSRLRPQALEFDPQTRAHVLQSDGTYASLHPVDSAVVLALFIERGKLRSATTTGNKLPTIPSPHDRRAKALATDYVKQALADLIARGDVSVLDVRLETRGSYATFVEVDYINERLYPRTVQTRGAPLG